MAFLTVGVALNIVLVLLAGAVIQRLRGGEIHGVGGLFPRRVDTGQRKASDALDALLVLPIVTGTIVVAYGALYHAISLCQRSAFVMPRHDSLGVIEGLYFSLVTAATVGYGDIQPHSHGAEIAVMSQIVAAATGLGLVAAYLLATRTQTSPDGKP